MYCITLVIYLKIVYIYWLCLRVDCKAHAKDSIIYHYSEGIR